MQAIKEILSIQVNVIKRLNENWSAVKKLEAIFKEFPNRTIEGMIYMNGLRVIFLDLSILIKENERNNKFSFYQLFKEFEIDNHGSLPENIKKLKESMVDFITKNEVKNFIDIRDKYIAHLDKDRNNYKISNHDLLNEIIIEFGNIHNLISQIIFRHSQRFDIDNAEIARSLGIFEKFNKITKLAREAIVNGSLKVNGQEILEISNQT